MRDFDDVRLVSMTVWQRVGPGRAVIAGREKQCAVKSAQEKSETGYRNAESAGHGGSRRTGREDRLNTSGTGPRTPWGPASFWRV